MDQNYVNTNNPRYPRGRITEIPCGIINNNPRVRITQFPRGRITELLNGRLQVYVILVEFAYPVEE
eukprot:5506825-Heterocapsa_arctica.AAC.1